jgi:very-short-patch-repair endonuclease
MRGLRIVEARRARALRADATAAETRLWAKLRNRGLNGFKFSRQVTIGPYFADFCCRARKLVVEVDGATQFDRRGTGVGCKAQRISHWARLHCAENS